MTHAWETSEIRFIKENLQFTDREFGIHFGITPTAIKGLRMRNKIIRPLEQWRFQKGRVPANKGQKMSEEKYQKCFPTMFKKGSPPPNAFRKFGDIYYIPDRTGKIYSFIKLSENRQYPLGRYVWEQKTGEKLSKYDIIRFKNNNQVNCEFDNLIKISRKENLRLNLNREKAAKALKHIWKMVHIYEDTGIKHRFGFRSKRSA